MPTYTLIQPAVVVGVLGAASIDFTSIPATYTDLVIKLSARTTTLGQDYASLGIRFNGNTSSVYSTRLVFGLGSGTPGSVNESSQTRSQWQYSTATTATSSTFGNVEIYIPNYASSSNKSMSVDSVTENNATSALAGLKSGLWANSAAITSITLFENNGAGNFVQHSTAYLYGVSNA
jgi:hypothetical protein